MTKIVALGNDHAGPEVKRMLRRILKERFGYIITEYGPDDSTAVDYPDVAHEVATDVKLGRAHFGILICGTGIGMSMVANRHEGIRAAVCTDSSHSVLTRQHNDANILCIGARTTTDNEIERIVVDFFNTQYEGGRHNNRLAKF
ncbi:MAG: ribose 5-phosphate isomerase B [Planctomycetaceae bacterium TMED240]|nr:MAG: ribose 5-phosphate isomerase B [Planctomycetaceae bacterium TMED240]